MCCNELLKSLFSTLLLGFQITRQDRSDQNTNQKMMVANRQLVKHDSLKNLIPSVPLLLPPSFFSLRIQKTKTVAKAALQ
jgi:hypothetical protein